MRLDDPRVLPLCQVMLIPEHRDVSLVQDFAGPRIPRPNEVFPNQGPPRVLRVYVESTWIHKRMPESLVCPCTSVVTTITRWFLRNNLPIDATTEVNHRRAEHSFLEP